MFNLFWFTTLLQNLIYGHRTVAWLAVPRLTINIIFSQYQRLIFHQTQIFLRIRGIKFLIPENSSYKISVNFAAGKAAGSSARFTVVKQYSLEYKQSVIWSIVPIHWGDFYFIYGFVFDIKRMTRKR